MSVVAEALKKIEQGRKQDKDSLIRGTDLVIPHHRDFRAGRTYLLIGAAMGLVLIGFIFWFGVRQGARLAEHNPSPEISETVRAAEEIPEPEPAVLAAEEPPEEAVTETPEPAIPREFLSIQLITYSRESQAEEEADRWRARGREVWVVKSGRYYQICLGRFEERDQAKIQLAEIKASDAGKAYRDAYIRMVRL